MSTGLLEAAWSATYVSDRETRKRLRRLVQTLQLPSENIGARLAIGRSLREGQVEGRTEGDLEPNGKELKGRTLFGGADIAVPLVAHLLAVEGPGRLKGGLRGVVVAHWQRGQQLLDRELTAYDDADSLLLAHIAPFVSVMPAPALDSAVLGQRAAVGRLETLRASAHQTPVVVRGLPGSGRTYVARQWAELLDAQVVTLTGTSIDTAAPLEHALRGLEGSMAVCADELDRSPASMAIELRRLLADDNRVVAVVATASTGWSTPGWQAVDLAPYDRDVVAEIVRRSHAWHIEVCRLIAMAGRLRPRQALERADEIAAARCDSDDPVSEKLAREWLDRWGLDRLGLHARDIALLRALAEHKAPRDAEGLARAMALSIDHVRNDVLPYLNELGLVTGRDGRWTLCEETRQLYG